MNERDLMEAAIRGIEEPPVPAQDNRPFWQRLLSSLRISVKTGKDLKHPIQEVTIKGGAEF